MSDPDAAAADDLIQEGLQLRSEGRWPQMLERLAPHLGSGLDARVRALLAEAYILGARDAEAIEILGPALATSPDDDLVQAALARLLLRRGDIQSAAQAATAACRHNPAEPDHRLLLAIVAGLTGRQDEALRITDQILAQHPRFAPGHARRAMILVALKRIDEARASARAAATLKYRHPEAWRLLANLGEAPAAIDALRHRLEVDPADAVAMVGLGEMLRASGRTEEALAWLSKAVEGRPSDPKAWAGYGTTLQEFERFPEARSAYETALSLAPATPAVAQNLAAMDFDDGRYEDVLKVLSPIAEGGNADPGIHLTLGKAALRLGRHTQSTAAFEAALRLDPDNPDALRALGLVGKAAERHGRRAVQGLLTLDDLDVWLQVLVCDPALGDVLETYDAWAGSVHAGPRELARLATYPLIRSWADGDMDAAAGLLPHLNAFEAREIRDRNPRRFFLFIAQLLAFRDARPELYAEGESVPEVYVLGESHALAPSNLLGRWRGAPARFRTRFVMGAKMFTLGSPSPNAISAHFDAHLDALPGGAELLITVGEIDSRPDEGIWTVCRRTGRRVEEIVADTVTCYLDSLQRRLGERSLAGVTLQGVPAPAYPVAERLEPDERQDDFLVVIQAVNAALESGARARGWDYLDTHGPTVGADGLSQRRWHIDAHHLSPAFYIEAADAARRASAPAPGS